MPCLRCSATAPLLGSGMIVRQEMRRQPLFAGRISFMIRSSGLLVRIFCQWMSGNA
jgi:hypothetical protein